MIMLGDKFTAITLNVILESICHDFSWFFTYFAYICTLDLFLSDLNN